MSVTTRDNSVTTKIFIVTLLRDCLSTLSLLCDNVTTKNEFFLRWESGRMFPERLQYDTADVGVLSAHYPRVHPRSARASPAVKHSALPPEAAGS